METNALKRNGSHKLTKTSIVLHQQLKKNKMRSEGLKRQQLVEKNGQEEIRVTDTLQGIQVSVVENEWIL